MMTMPLSVADPSAWVVLGTRRRCVFRPHRPASLDDLVHPFRWGRKSGRHPVGTGGRHGPEQVDGMNRNRRSPWPWSCGKSRGHALATSQMISEVINEYRDELPVSRMCRMLGVSRSGYYAWRGRPPSEREMANRELDRKIKHVYDRSRGTCGSPRIYRELKGKALAAGRTAWHS